MAGITNHRWVNLLDNRFADRPFIKARVYLDCSAGMLEEIEESWADSRKEAAQRGQAAGLVPLEHAHWDWRTKADTVEAAHHMVVAIEVATESDGEVQGLMAVARLARPARRGDGYVVYVDYLESAPWNLKDYVEAPRFLGVGTVLMAEAVRISAEMGCEGRVGLHSLPQAEVFYDKCRMTRLGEDPTYYDLVYYEYSGRQGIDWLTSIGGSV